jgi:hypothetical protein
MVMQHASLEILVGDRTGSAFVGMLNEILHTCPPPSPPLSPPLRTLSAQISRNLNSRLFQDLKWIHLSTPYPPLPLIGKLAEPVICYRALCLEKRRVLSASLQGQGLGWEDSGTTD